jgi:hypothetical protein
MTRTRYASIYQFSHEVYGYDLNSRLRSTKRNEDQRRDEFIYIDAGELTRAEYGQQWNGTTWANPNRFQGFTPDLARQSRPGE